MAPAEFMISWAAVFPAIRSTRAGLFPHFEKMLYDQAQLAGVYLTAWQISRESIYQETARDILQYVQKT